MPPKRGGPVQRGGPAPQRGSARGGRGGGGPPTRGGGAGSASSPSTPAIIPAGHIQSIGVKRISYGKSGKEVKVITNQFELKSECPRIFHYDAVVPEDKVVARPLMQELYQKLKKDFPAIFSSLAFDGRKNLYSATRLPFQGDRQEYQVQLQTSPSPSGKAAKVYHVRFTKTHQEIIPEVLNRFVTGQASHDNDVTVAINSLNVVLGMFPSEVTRYATNGKSTFVPEGAKNIGHGLTLWRGFFQSVRPTLGKMVVNVDISTGMMYSPGPLIQIALEHLKRNDIRSLESPMHDADIRSLSKFVSKLRIITNHNTNAGDQKPRTIKGVLSTSAATTKFDVDGKSMTVQQYFQTTYGKPLKHPKLICVQLTSGAAIPIEICVVPPGQMRARAQPPPELTKDVVEFATKKPQERLASIRSSLQQLGYGQSPYLRAFSLQVAPEPSKVNARVLQPPSLIYAASKTVSIPVGAGQWTMAPNRFYTVSGITTGWAIISFAKQNFWPEQKIRAVAEAFAKDCTACGITGMEWPRVQPTILTSDPMANATAVMESLGTKHGQLNGGKVPGLVVVILPMQGAASIYKQIKYFGDVRTGCATQCMMENKCWKGNGPAGGSYYANIALKVNAKLGGINVVSDQRHTGGLLGDPQNPVLIMGADAIHPPPESQGRPSFTAVVGSLDINASKYVASCRPQTSKQEIIADMEEMTTEILRDYKAYKPGPPPKKIIMFRDGVSEGQFAQVIEHEIPQIRDACKKLNFTPKITFVVVGKRHHVRFFPESSANGDRTGNCLAGTVVEQGVSHPVEFDYYLQSHAGLLGTSRPAHYNVLLDENNLSPDALQQLTYTLCHIYARSTRSVSIPAPTYYADIVCSRSANHYDPKGNFHPDSYAENSSGTQRLADAKDHFSPVHALTRRRMYFS